MRRPSRLLGGGGKDLGSGRVREARSMEDQLRTKYFICVESMRPDDVVIISWSW